MFKRYSIQKAIYDDELNNLLHSLNIFNDFENRRLQCKFCKTIIDYNNLHSIFPYNGKIYLCCDSYNCVRKLLLLFEK